MTDETPETCGNCGHTTLHEEYEPEAPWIFWCERPECLCTDDKRDAYAKGHAAGYQRGVERLGDRWREGHAAGVAEGRLNSDRELARADRDFRNICDSQSVVVGTLRATIATLTEERDAARKEAESTKRQADAMILRLEKSHEKYDESLRSQLEAAIARLDEPAEYGSLRWLELQLAALQKENEAIRKAAEAFARKVDRIERSPEMGAIYSLARVHGASDVTETWAKEFSDLMEELSRSEFKLRDSNFAALSAEGVKP